MSDLVEIDATATHDLRRRVLRAGDRNANVHWPGDDEATTLHLAMTDDGTIVAISTWLQRPCPTAADIVARQLRGMATDPRVRGRGLAAMLLAEGVRRARARGFALQWANARLDAVGFYERHGWVAHGPVFATAETGLPHRIVTLDMR